LHGGAYVLGSAKAYCNFASQFAARTGINVFVAEYGLAPEANHRANENMMAMVIELIRDLRGGQQNKKKKKMMPKVIRTTDLPSTKRRYNQRSKDHNGQNQMDIHHSHKRTDGTNMEKMRTKSPKSILAHKTTS
jgi:hypothetical protein